MLNTTFKKGLVGLALLATLTGGGMAVAQTGGPMAPPPGTSEHHGHHGFDSLNLTDAQKAQMKTIWEGSKAARKAEHAKFESQLKLVLNQDQWAKYQAHKQSMEQKEEQWKKNPQAHVKDPNEANEANEHHGMGDKDKGHGHRHHDWIGHNLNLTTEQKAQLQAFRESQAPTLKSQHDQMNSQIRAILTPAQQAQWDQMMQHRQHDRGGKA